MVPAAPTDVDLAAGAVDDAAALRRAVDAVTDPVVDAAVASTVEAASGIRPAVTDRQAAAAADPSVAPTGAVDRPRATGRPRDPKVDAAILGATLELLAAGGYEALTIEAVSAAAGVGKASVYRRFPGKEQLVVEAVASLIEPLEPPVGTSVRDGLVTLLEAVRRKSASSLADKIFPRLLGAGADNPELIARYREQVLEPRRRRFLDLLERGVHEGLVRADVDLEHATDLLVGPMAYRNLIRRDPPPGPELAARIVDDVLVALGPRPSEPARRPDQETP